MFLPRRRKKANTDKSGDVRSHGHLQFVRGFECSASESDSGSCSGKIEAHHIRVGSNAGADRKPGDDKTVPLCSFHHTQFHNMGHHSFERRHKLNLSDIARAIWSASRHRIKWEADHE